MSSPQRQSSESTITGWIALALLLSVVGGLAAIAAVWGSPWTVPAIAWVVFSLAIQVGGFVAIRRELQPIGAVVLAVGSVMLLPAGALGIVAAVRSYMKFRFGTALGHEEDERPPRPRAWTLGTVVFGLAAALSMSWALIHPHTTDLRDFTDPLVISAGAVLGILAGIEAALLWTQHDDAVRLGVALSVSMIAVCALAGFMLHSYLAVALISLPVYGLYLVLRGRRKWAGLERTDAAGIELRGRARSGLG